MSDFFNARPRRRREGRVPTDPITPLPRPASDAPAPEPYPACSRCSRLYAIGPGLCCIRRNRWNSNGFKGVEKSVFSICSRICDGFGKRPSSLMEAVSPATGRFHPSGTVGTIGVRLYSAGFTLCRIFNAPRSASGREGRGGRSDRADGRVAGVVACMQ